MEIYNNICMYFIKKICMYLFFVKGVYEVIGGNCVLYLKSFV